MYIHTYTVFKNDIITYCSVAFLPARQYFVNVLRCPDIRIHLLLWVQMPVHIPLFGYIKIYSASALVVGLRVVAVFFCCHKQCCLNFLVHVDLGTCAKKEFWKELGRIKGNEYYKTVLGMPHCPAVSHIYVPANSI